MKLCVSSAVFTLAVLFSGGGKGLFFRREKIFFHLRFFHLPFIFAGYTLIIPQDAVNTKKEMEI